MLIGKNKSLTSLLGHALGIMRVFAHRLLTLPLRYKATGIGVAAGFILLSIAVWPLDDASQSTPEQEGATTAQTETAPAPEKASSLSQGTADAKTAIQTASLDAQAPTIDTAPQPPLYEELTLTVQSGDTLMAMLTDAGLDRPQAHRAILSLATVFSPRKLKPGHQFELALTPGDEENPAQLETMMFEPDRIQQITVARRPNEETADIGDSVFVADTIERPLTTNLNRTQGVIDSSLYVAALDAGVPSNVLGEMINIFAFDIDFQREIQPQDRFALLFEERLDEDGVRVDTGNILLAEMTVNGKQRRYYRFVDQEGFIDFYDASGRSVRKALLRTPVDGARISSRFGKRRHPILGYTKMHKGMDFAAPRGTPIYAAGDGVVEAAGWLGGYGKYVRIRHNSTYKTAYAHMSRIDSRVKAGQRVRQRQIIGYVGSTGRSTGPHLHYEVHKNGHQVNPQGVRLPTGKTLAGNDLERFKRAMAKAEQQFAKAGALSGPDTASLNGIDCQSTEGAPKTATC